MVVFAAMAATPFMMAALMVFMTFVVTLVFSAAGRGLDVVVLGAFHPGSLEAVAELYAADAGDGEQGM